MPCRGTETGDTARAIEYHRDAENLVTDPASRASVRVLLARDLIADGRRDDALDILDLALEDAHEGESRTALAEVLVMRAGLLDTTTQLEEARSNAATALQIFSDVGMPAGQASAEHELARLALAVGDPAGAAQHAQTSIDLECGEVVVRVP